MKKGYALLLAVMVLAALALPLSAFAASSPSHDVVGKLTAIDAKHATIHTSAGANVTLKIRSTTKFYVENHPAKRSSLRVGDTVDAEYNPVTMVAIRIEKQAQ